MPLKSFKLKIAVVALLFLAPALFAVGVGFYHLWVTGWSFWAYFPMALSFLASYLLGWYWMKQARKAAVQPDVVPGADYWTDQDRKAWKLVEESVATLVPISPEQMSDLNRYASEAQILALRICRVYKPTATDPFGHLTLPEILACGELVSHDLSKLVGQYVPGSHMLAVDDYKRIRNTVDKVSDWYPRLRGLYWIATAFIDPVRVGAQVAMTKAGLTPAYQNLQQNVLHWLHVAYVKELGRYLIELNSGRLRVGAKRYLELMEQHQAPPTEVPTDEPAQQPAEGKAKESPKPVVNLVTVSIVGPVKSGKSTLVNTLLGEQKAIADVLPHTAMATRYELRQPDLPTFALFDSVGFGQEGAKDEDVLAAVELAKQSDLLLLAVPSRSAARLPESDFLDRVRKHFDSTPHLKMPPVVLVLTQIDQLTPAVEWAPPYDWRDGKRPKETSIRNAVGAAREVFGDRVMDVLPLCALPGKEHGVRDELLPFLAVRLGEVRGVALLRALHAEASVDRNKRVVNQLLNVGGEFLKAWWANAKK